MTEADIILKMPSALARCIVAAGSGDDYVAYGEDAKGWTVIEDEISGTRRWAIDHRIIVEHSGAFYEAIYSEGATEYQDQSAFDYGETQDFFRVYPIEKTVTTYVRPSTEPEAPAEGICEAMGLPAVPPFPSI